MYNVLHFVNLIGSLLSLEILIDRLVTKLPSMKKVSPSTAIPLGEETMPNLQADRALRIQIGSIVFQLGFEPKDFL